MTHRLNYQIREYVRRKVNRLDPQTEMLWF